MPPDLFADLDPEDRATALSALRHDVARRRRRAEAATASSKRCPTCCKDLPLTEFAHDSTRHDGLRGQCRACGRRAREARASKG